MAKDKEKKEKKAEKEKKQKKEKKEGKAKKQAKTKEKAAEDTEIELAEETELVKEQLEEPTPAQKAKEVAEEKAEELKEEEEPVEAVEEAKEEAKPEEAAPAEEEEELEIVEEKFYSLNLRKIWSSPREKRTPRAVRFLRDFVARHMKTDEVAISEEANQMLWKRGISKPPRKIRVRAVKDKDGRVIVFPGEGK